VDHIIPVAANATTWDDYINNLFCDSDNLQVLCIGCHKKKTVKEKNESK